MLSASTSRSRSRVVCLKPVGVCLRLQQVHCKLQTCSSQLSSDNQLIFLQIWCNMLFQICAKMWCFDCLCSKKKFHVCQLCHDEVPLPEWNSASHRFIAKFSLKMQFLYFSRIECAVKNEKLLHSFQEAICYKCHKCSCFLREWSSQVLYEDWPP